MKKYFALAALIFFISQTHAQSNSYQTIRDTFRGGTDVHAFSVSGFLSRVVLTIADEYEFRDAITDIKNIKLVVMPKAEFASRNLSLNGFKKILKDDSFQELAHVRDNGDYVSFYIQENRKNKDRYFILVDEGHEVVAIEMKGYIDMNKLMEMRSEIAMNEN